ncbi:hypothetical protein PsAD2_00541 [Pseudovibrio axinellae]|uniref:Transglutaminase-like domain protein n=1 Tax=Pseudovibrio axinellae TaxID=989403 RepID=A0A166AKX4_9HYPH|nr:transglutaminase-like cysteine peptidase [Pseudovibrio axinellae]KZL21251.1 hypothetical protein PsAD2_00541 [Pseudovibrio axinellae]SEQ93560.1 Predicted transglutaminase-like cysteine proteinase [Pseudovibrio axinellae]
MFEYKLFAKSVFGIVISGLLGLSHANAEQVPGRFMPVIGQASAPIGHREFCRNYPVQCEYGTNTPLVVRLTKERWQELLDINTNINANVRPLTDDQLFGVAEYWTYPQGAGDCEEYVLEKQRQLINLGWPPSALLITVVKDLDNGGHAVLSVRTDQGDLILDNQVTSILPWYSTPYRYVKRQSARNAAAWSAISDKRVTTVASIPE